MKGPKPRKLYNDVSLKSVKLRPRSLFWIEKLKKSLWKAWMGMIHL